MTTITTTSGRTRDLPLYIDADRVAGLDEDGRIVVDDFGGRKAWLAGKRGQDCPHLFGLTLCCDAYDKGCEDGVVCRACYGMRDTGNYLFPTDAGFPGLDPVASVR